MGSPLLQPFHQAMRRIAVGFAVATLLWLLLTRPACAAEVEFAELGEWVSSIISLVFTSIGGMFLELTRRRSNAQEREMADFRKMFASHQQASQKTFESQRKDREAGLAGMRKTMDELRDRMVRRDELEAAERRHKDRMAEVREEHRTSQLRSDQRFAGLEAQLGQLSGRVDQLHKQAADTHKTVSEVHQQLGRLAETWGAQ